MARWNGCFAYVLLLIADLGYRINQAMFQRNGHCGYVLKPEALRCPEKDLLSKRTQHFLDVTVRDTRSSLAITFERRLRILFLCRSYPRSSCRACGTPAGRRLSRSRSSTRTSRSTCTFPTGRTRHSCPNQRRPPARATRPQRTRRRRRCRLRAPSRSGHRSSRITDSTRFGKKNSACHSTA